MNVTIEKPFVTYAFATFSLIVTIVSIQKVIFNLTGGM